MHYLVYLLPVLLLRSSNCKAANGTCLSEALPCIVEKTMAKYPDWFKHNNIASSDLRIPPDALLTFQNDVLEISCSIKTRVIKSSSYTNAELKIDSVKHGFKIVHTPLENFTFEGLPDRYYNASGTVKNINFVATNKFTAQFQTPDQVVTYENVKLINDSNLLDLISAPVIYNLVSQNTESAHFYGIKLANGTESTEYINIINDVLLRLYYRHVFHDNWNYPARYPDVKYIHIYLQDVFQTTPVTSIPECWKFRSNAVRPHSGNMRLMYLLSTLVVFVDLATQFVFFYNFK